MRLNEITEINKQSIDPAKEYPSEEIYYIDIDSIENGTGRIKYPRLIKGKDAPSRARRVVHTNDVIMSTVRPYLKAFAIVPPELDGQICSTGFAVLTCKEDVDPKYLLYSLFSKNVIDQCNRMMMGGQYPALNTSQVERITIPLPPLPTQKKIAEILSTADRAIQKVDEAIEKTQRLKKGVMHRLLTKGIGHTEFKETEIGRIPKEWEVVKLKEVARIRGNRINKKLDEYAFIPMELLPENELFAKYLIKGKQEIKSYTYCESGDVLLAKITPSLENGKQGIVPDNIPEKVALATTEVFPIQCENIYNGFLFYILKMAKYRNILITSMIGTTGRQRASKDVLEKLNIPVPSLREQKRIFEILQTIDRRIESLTTKKQKLQRIKQGLMNELLSGKREV